MIDEKTLNLEDWSDEMFGSDMSDDYKEGFNHSLYLIRNEIKNAVVLVGE